MEQKHWLDSTTIRAALVTYVPMVVLLLNAFGVEIGDSEQSQIIEGIMAVVGLISLGYVIYGRIRAVASLYFGKRPDAS